VNYRVILWRSGKRPVRLTTLPSRVQAYDFRKEFAARHSGVKLKEIKVLRLGRNPAITGG
jgi:hypothetical protein